MFYLHYVDEEIWMGLKDYNLIIFSIKICTECTLCASHYAKYWKYNC